MDLLSFADAFLPGGEVFSCSSFFLSDLDFTIFEFTRFDRSQAIPASRNISISALEANR